MVSCWIRAVIWRVGGMLSWSFLERLLLSVSQFVACSIENQTGNTNCKLKVHNELLYWTVLLISQLKFNLVMNVVQTGQVLIVRFLLSDISVKLTNSKYHKPHLDPRPHCYELFENTLDYTWRYLDIYIYMNLALPNTHWFGVPRK